MGNSYKTRDGNRVKKTIIDKKVRSAKERKVLDMEEMYGYVFCEDCGINSRQGIPLDCSHDISVKKCQETGRSELAWSVDNITIRCRNCHRKHDNS